MCLESSYENLLLGTEGGNIFFIDLSTFELSDNIIYQDVVMQKYAQTTFYCFVLFCYILSFILGFQKSIKKTLAQLKQ